tara:strand:+ start:269 stop:463 length:195 start_codon:yes stop_codon:yes gene_type:complete
LVEVSFDFVVVVPIAVLIGVASVVLMAGCSWDGLLFGTIAEAAHRNAIADALDGDRYEPLQGAR